MLRTKTCGETRRTDVGQTVTLCGWVDSYRDHSEKLMFIDLRDRYGKTQVVVDADSGAEVLKLAKSTRTEDVIQISGVVTPRIEGQVNPKLDTGEIEIRCRALKVLNKSATLPFQPGGMELPNEELRLKYRYLDLRRPAMQRTILLRHRIIKAMRDYFDEHNFVEVETPMLGRSTPEGARDYLVPSRVQNGSFYALPQSPQLYKQILMMAGYDRYVQVARCFRDEDLRADRQPEFTQLDLEMSFVEADDVMGIIEGLVERVAAQVLNLPVQLPLARMTYDEAMERFGHDAPDLRYGMELIDCTDIAAQCEFRVFRGAADAGNKVRGVNATGAAAKYSRKDIDLLTDWVCKNSGAKGLAWFKVMYDEHSLFIEIQNVFRDSMQNAGDHKERSQAFMNYLNSLKILSDETRLIQKRKSFKQYLEEQSWPDELKAKLSSVVTTKVFSSSIVKNFTDDELWALADRMQAKPGDLLLFLADTFEVTCKGLHLIRKRFGAELKLYDPATMHFSWITEFPMFAKSEDEGETGWAAMHHPFTAPRPQDLELLKTDPEKCRAVAYDLVINGSEAGGGTIRIHDQAIQQQVFHLLGIDEQTQRDRFGFLLDALQFGAPPHGGIALGIDRWIMLFAGLDNIRDVIAFPKTQRATDLMTEAPGSVDVRQLRDLGIEIKKRPE